MEENEVHTFGVFPDVNPKLAFMADLAISAFERRRNQLKKEPIIPGRLLYCAGLNDSYKEYIMKKTEDDPAVNLYNAIEFRKFHRLDLYAENILSVIHFLSLSERCLLSAEIIIHLIIQYKCLKDEKKFKIDLPRNFLKFLPGLKAL